MNARDAARILQERDNILLLTHKNPDGDTIGAATALCSALRRRGKTAWLYPNRQVSAKLAHWCERYFAPADFQPTFTVAVDVATEKLFALGFEGNVDFCIDHHPTNSHYARRELILPDRSSCGEIVLDVIKALCAKPNREEADLLYIALSTDTGCFQYSNVNARSFRAAAELAEAGAELQPLNLSFFRKVSDARIRLEGMIYNSMSFHHGGRVVVATVTRDMLRAAGATEDDCDDLAGLPGRSESGVLSLLIREQPDGTSKVSVRSLPGISSSEVCAAFGGGGHPQAAGCTISEPPERAKEMLLAVVDEVLR